MDSDQDGHDDSDDAYPRTRLGGRRAASQGFWRFWQQ